MKVIAIFSSRAEAEMAQGFLTNMEIPSHVSADDEGGLHPALGAQAGAKLLVPDEFEQQALEILEKSNSN